MLDLSLILIVMATLFNTPSNINTQADYQLVNSGINMAPLICKGNLFLETGKSAETQRLRFHHTCHNSQNIDQDQPEETETSMDDALEVDIILDFEKKRAIMINHKEKSYRMDVADKNMLERFAQHMNFAKGQSQPFLDNTKFWLHTSKSDFWLSRIQDPAQQNLFTDLNLFSTGLNSHLSLKYSSTAIPKDTFEVPANYKQQQVQ